MKQIIKFLFLLAALMPCSLTVPVSGQTVTFHVATAGTYKTVSKFSWPSSAVYRLNITGEINGDDVQAIRDDVNKKNISFLDLSQTKVKAGGRYAVKTWYKMGGGMACRF